MYYVKRSFSISLISPNGEVSLGIRPLGLKRKELSYAVNFEKHEDRKENDSFR